MNNEFLETEQNFEVKRVLTREFYHRLNDNTMLDELKTDVIDDIDDVKSSLKANWEFEKSEYTSFISHKIDVCIRQLEALKDDYTQQTMATCKKVDGLLSAIDHLLYKTLEDKRGF